MRNAGGYAVVSGPGGVTEMDTFTCCHCQRVVLVPAKAAATDCGGFCTLCMKHTCGPCADKGCAPFEKKLEAMERRGRLLRAAGVE